MAEETRYNLSQKINDDQCGIKRCSEYFADIYIKKCNDEAWNSILEPCEDRDPTLNEEKVLEESHKIWNKRISRILCRAYGDGVINSEQLHILTSAFDPSQDHKVYGPNFNKGFK